MCFRDILPEEETGNRASERMLRVLLRLLCRPGFRHCFAYTQLADACCLVMDPRSNGLDVTIRDTSAFPGVGHVAPAHQHFQRGWRPRGLFTCVTAVKHLLGIRAWWIITPHQLYRYLQRRAD